MTASRATSLLCLLLALSDDHWQAFADDSPTTTSESYFSAAEGRRQGFQVVLPPGFSRDEKYPLIVQVFGSKNLLPTKERPFIRVNPSGRGVWGYRGMSRYDVMQTIARMIEAWPVDADRVYITGTSAGATGVMHAAAQRPDVFAGVVPLVAFGNDLPLENFTALPVRCEHGINDWTSAICNVRVQFQKLARLQVADAKLNEHPTAGHGVRIPPPDTMDWLFRLRRNHSAEHIRYSCEHPRDGRAYWLTIKQFVDPHKVARIESQRTASGLAITTGNVRRFSVDLTTAPLSDGRTLRVDGTQLKVLPGTAQKTLFLHRENGGWQVSGSGSEPSLRRMYGAGAAANLFQGEPLLVVYGTGGDAEENGFLRQAAGVLARTGGPTFKPASVRFPVRADSDLDDVSLEEHNLLIVGTSENNSLLRSIAADLPYRIEAGNLHTADRAPLPLAGSVLGFHYFSPQHPQRTIYVVSPWLDAQQRAAFLRNPRLFLAGSDGFKMIDQPDLLLRGVDGRIRREMQLSADWQFIRMDGADDSIPDRFADRTYLGEVYTQVMHEHADTDFALWWGPEDKGLFGGYDFNWLTAFDPGSYTRADWSVRRRETETMTGRLPGSELRDIFDRWISTRELISWPPIARDDIDDNRDYSIVIPMDLVPKLGIRRRVLSDVAPGPMIMPAQIADKVFE